MDVVTYVLSRKYTDKSIKGISGTLAGKNCTIASIEQVEGGNLVTFEWYSDEGDTQTSTMFVQDGVLGENAIAPTYDPTQTYNKNDLVVYENELYKLGVSTTTGEFNPNVWDLTNIDELLATKANSVDLATVATSGSASDVSFDNSETELDSTNVQDAIVEVLEEAGKIADVQTYGNTLVTNKIADLSALTIKKSIANTPTDIASFDDGTANPMPSLEISIEPVQSGSGDPSPSNVRPISGWSGANVTRTGVNVWDEEWERGSLNTYTGQPGDSNSKIRTVNYIPVLPNTEYRIVGYALAIYEYGSDNSFIGYTTYSVGTFITGANTYFIKWTRTGTSYANDISINYPSTDTSYHAYQGSILSIPFHDNSDNPITVYGGRLNVTSGSCLSYDSTIQLSSINSFSSDEVNTNGYIRYNCAVSDKAQNYNIMCDKIKVITNYTVPVDASSELISGSSASDKLYFTINSARLTGDLSTASGRNQALKTLLQTDDIQVAYELATPQTYQLTPAQVTTLLGKNNIFADCGQILEGEYFADASTVIAGLDARITALENA